MPEGDFVGDQPMPVFLKWRPARKAQPPAWPYRTEQVSEGRYRVAKEHHPEARRDQVEAVGLEGMHLRVRLQQRDVAQTALRDPLARCGQHRLGDVDPDDLAGVADCLGQGYRRRACAAADLQHLLPGPYSDRANSRSFTLSTRFST